MIFGIPVKNYELTFSVIPALRLGSGWTPAGIQSFRILTNSLDSGFHRSDGCPRSHHPWDRI